MISEAITAEDNYQAAFRALRSATQTEQNPSWLERMRENAMERFAVTGFPSVTEEEWKYTNVSQIARQEFSPFTAVLEADSLLNANQLAEFTYPETARSQLVFVNGRLDETLSSLSDLPAGVVAIDFAAALGNDTYREIVREYLGRIVDYSENGFTALNTAFISSGALVFIPQGVSLEKPLHLLFVTSPGDLRPATFPRMRTPRPFT